MLTCRGLNSYMRYNQRIEQTIYRKLSTNASPPRISTPYKFKCGQRSKNRICRASLAEGYSSKAEGASPTDVHISMYKEFSKGGSGIILTGHVMIDREQKCHLYDPVLDRNSDLEAYNSYADACKGEGCLALMQLNHPGRQTDLCKGPALCPSPLPLTGAGALRYNSHVPRMLTHPQIELIITKFGDSALLAKRSGFNGVQVHCAHGYLLSQFFSPLVNQRTDIWGGSLHNRMRILIRILQEIRDKCGHKFILGIKINSADFQKGGFKEEECTELLKVLDSSQDIDFVELSGGTAEGPQIKMAAITRESTRLREGFFIEFAEKLCKEINNVGIMLTGGLRSREGMNAALANGVHLVGVGRPFCLQPNWPNLMLNGNIHRTMDYDNHKQENNLWHVKQLHRIGMGLKPDVDLPIV